MALLERKNELQSLAKAFATARSGAGAVVLIAGEAGIGKSTLVRHFVAGLDPATRILIGNCDPLFTPSPLGPLYDIARSLDPALQRMLAGETKRATLFSAVHEALRTSNQPVVLVIEDIHWADDATLDLLKYLVRRLDGLRLLLITTHRDDALGRLAPLRRLLGELSGAAKVERLALERLSVAAVRTLTAGKAIDAVALHRQTSGNPFFVTEVVASNEPGIPVTVRDAVLARVAQLTPRGLALVEHAAIAGSRIGQDFLERVAGPVADAVTEGLESGILQSAGDEILFRHELAREAILESIDPIRRRQLFRDTLREAEQEAGHDRNALARLAHYAECAADHAAVLRYGAAAARAAIQLGAHREAAAQYRRVLRFAERMTQTDRAEYLMKLAEQCALIDDLAAAASAYREAAGLWSTSGDARSQGRALAAMAWPLVRSGRNVEAEQACAAAVILLEALPPSAELGAAYRIQAHLRMLDRDAKTAVRIGEQAIAIAARFGDLATVAAAEMVVGSALLVNNDDAGRVRLDRCLGLAQQHDLADLTALALLNIGSSYGEQYRFAEAERELERGIAFALGRDLDHAHHYMTAWLAIVRMYQGRWAEAGDLATAVLAVPGVAAISRIMALTALGRLRLRRGDPGAGQALDEAMDLAMQTGTLQRLAPVHAARAEAGWIAGDRSRTQAEATALYGMAVTRQHRWHTAEAVYWLALCGAPVESIAWTGTPFAAEIAGDRTAAAAGWNALGCPYEAARVQADGTAADQSMALDAFDRLGAAPAAAALRKRMRNAGIGRIPRGPRSSTRSHPAGLTRREVVVLDCLAEELTNREIAARLFISEKTVDHHISAILGKLGAANRKEAARMARSGPEYGEPDAAKWGKPPDADGPATPHDRRAR